MTNNALGRDWGKGFPHKSILQLWREREFLHQEGDTELEEQSM